MTTATLTLKDHDYELPLVVGSEGEVGIDVTSLRKQSMAITFDPGYGNTGSRESAITFIDGERGILRYRGYPIEELARDARFSEVCYLLIYGELPNEAELAAFDRNLTYHSLIHEDMKKFFEGYPPRAHPMAILASMVDALSTYYPDAENAEDIEPRIDRRRRTADRKYERAGQIKNLHEGLGVHHAFLGECLMRCADTSLRCNALVRR